MNHIQNYFIPENLFSVAVLHSETAMFVCSIDFDILTQKNFFRKQRKKIFDNENIIKQL